jgi:hypothetical protein
MIPLAKNVGSNSECEAIFILDYGGLRFLPNNSKDNIIRDVQVLVLIGGQKSRLTNRWTPPCGSRALGTQTLRNNTK